MRRRVEFDMFDDIDNKKWYCFYPDCKWYKVYMTPEQHWLHMIKIHNMKCNTNFVNELETKNNSKKKHKKRK